MNPRLYIPFDPDGPPVITGLDLYDRVTSFVAGPDGLTCYLQGESGDLYAGTAHRGKLKLELV